MLYTSVAYVAGGLLCMSNHVVYKCCIRSWTVYSYRVLSVQYKCHVNRTWNSSLQPLV